MSEWWRSTLKTERQKTKQKACTTLIPKTDTVWRILTWIRKTCKSVVFYSREQSKNVETMQKVHIEQKSLSPHVLKQSVMFKNWEERNYVPVSELLHSMSFLYFFPICSEHLTLVKNLASMQYFC